MIEVGGRERGGLTILTVCRRSSLRDDVVDGCCGSRASLMRFGFRAVRLGMCAKALVEVWVAKLSLILARSVEQLEICRGVEEDVSSAYLGIAILV